MLAHWELVATLPGGTVTSLLRVGGVVLAATPAGVRQSRDGGRSWLVLGGATHPAPELVMASPAYAADGLLLAGSADGLVRSQDAGQSWQAALVGSRVLAIAFSPGFHQDGLVLVGTEQDGVLRSSDRGRTWTSGNPGLLDLTVLGLSCSPAFDVDQTVFAATASGLFRSPNAGRAWRAIESLPGEPAVQAIALSPSFRSSPVILAGTEADGLLRSTDGGVSWSSVEALAERSVTTLAWWGGTDVVAGTDVEVMASHDRGATWSPVGSRLGPVLSVAVAPDGALLAGLPRRGVVRSHDRVSWERADAGLQANLVVSIALSPAFERDHTLYVAGLEDGVSLSSDAGATWESATTRPIETAVFGLAAGRDGLYAATGAGVFHRRLGHDEWKQVHPGAARALRAAGARVVAVGMSGALVASSDGAGSWQPLPWPSGSGQPQAVDLAGSSTLVVVSVDLSRSEVAVWQSTDGQRWQRLLAEPAADAPALAVPLAAVGDGPIFVGVGDSVLRGVADAHDGWRWRRAGLPATVTSLAASPAYRQDTTVLAGTSAGVCISRDGGVTFEPWGAGMGNVPVVAVAFSPAYGADRLVYAVELGGRIWRQRGR